MNAGRRILRFSPSQSLRKACCNRLRAGARFLLTRVVLGFGAERLMPWRPARGHTCALHSACGARRAIRTQWNRRVHTAARRRSGLEGNFHAIVGDANLDTTLGAHRLKFRCESAFIAGNDFRAAVREYCAGHSLFHAPAELRLDRSVAD
jgi:hypothetical protein